MFLLTVGLSNFVAFLPWVAAEREAGGFLMSFSLLPRGVVRGLIVIPVGVFGVGSGRTPFDVSAILPLESMRESDKRRKGRGGGRRKREPKAKQN